MTEEIAIREIRIDETASRNDSGPRFTRNLTTNRRRKLLLKFRRYDYDMS